MAPVEAVRSSERERLARIDNIARVLVQLSWVAQKQFAQSVARHELTFPQFLTLAFLVKASQHCSMNQLAEATHQDAATMTGVVDRLERLELVERTRSAEDRRVVLVRHRKEAVELLNDVKNARDQMMANLFEEFDDDALAELSHQLEKLWQAIEAQARSYGA